MSGVKRAALLGDLVGSREAGDRSALHALVLDALAAADPGSSAIDPLRVTVGEDVHLLGSPQLTPALPKLPAAPAA